MDRGYFSLARLKKKAILKINRSRSLRLSTSPGHTMHVGMCYRQTGAKSGRTKPNFLQDGRYSNSEKTNLNGSLTIWSTEILKKRKKHFDQGLRFSQVSFDLADRSKRSRLSITWSRMHIFFIFKEVSSSAKNRQPSVILPNVEIMIWAILTFLAIFLLFCWTWVSTMQVYSVLFNFDDFDIQPLLDDDHYGGDTVSLRLGCLPRHSDIHSPTCLVSSGVNIFVGI